MFPKQRAEPLIFMPLVDRDPDAGDLACAIQQKAAIASMMPIRLHLWGRCFIEGLCV